MRLPPRSTLFPLHDALPISFLSRRPRTTRKHSTARPGLTRAEWARTRPLRSEEHTSELQSLTNLVCRLLLEKKKQLKHESSRRHRQATHGTPEVARQQKTSR